MNHRALKRIFKKNFGITEISELESLLSGIGSEMWSNLTDFLEQVDSALLDQEKMIEIRDRSLTISSQELIAMNDEIVNASRKQLEILQKLKSMLNLLQEGSTSGLSGDSDNLDTILTTVEALIEKQKRSSRAFQIMYEEGNKLASARNISDLRLLSESSISRLLSTPCSVFLEVSPEYLRFYPNENLIGSPALAMASGRVFPVESASSRQVIAKLSVSVPGNSGSLDMESVQAFLPNISTTLENIKLVQEEKIKQILSHELKTARFVQQALLPKSNNLSGINIEINGHYQSASECGGDWWTSISLPDDKKLVIVGDVTGHGTASAMITAVVKGYCDSISLRSEIQPSELLRELNEIIFAMSTESQRAMTMAVLLVDPVQLKLVYSNAGHPNPIIMRQGSKEEVSYLTGNGDVLGVHGTAHFNDHKVDLQAGDRLVIFTDGLTESLNPQDEIYGDRRLYRLLKKTQAESSAEQINQKILADRDLFSRGRDLNDDITSVVVQILN